MEELYKREIYGETMALTIESMGATAVSIANRWALFSEKKVVSLLVDQQFLPLLQEQVATETEVLAEANGLSHLTRYEILRMHEVCLLPPALTQAAPAPQG